MPEWPSSKSNRWKKTTTTTALDRYLQLRVVYLRFAMREILWSFAFALPTQPRVLHETWRRFSLFTLHPLIQWFANSETILIESAHDSVHDYSKPNAFISSDQGDDGCCSYHIVLYTSFFFLQKQFWKFVQIEETITHSASHFKCEVIKSVFWCFLLAKDNTVRCVELEKRSNIKTFTF